MKFIYYSAAWCAPCKKVWPWVEALAAKFGVSVETVDIDQEFVGGILSVPALDIVSQGETLKRIVKWSSQSALKMEVEEVM